jgi:hypothetical protein
MSDRDEENADFDTVSAMADRLGLEGKERNKYVHEHMDRLGYDAVPTYVRREEESQERESGGFFGGRDRGSSRDSGRRRERDSDDWYGR